MNKCIVHICCFLETKPLKLFTPKKHSGANQLSMSQLQIKSSTHRFQFSVLELQGSKPISKCLLSTGRQPDLTENHTPLANIRNLQPGIPFILAVAFLNHSEAVLQAKLLISMHSRVKIGLKKGERKVTPHYSAYASN